MYNNLSAEERNKLKDELLAEFNELKEKNLKLMMTRGVPCSEQLDLSNQLLNITDYESENGTDCRNYGIVEGIPECRKLFADLFNLDADQVLLGGNSSLNIMHDMISRAMIIGVPGVDEPWFNQKPKFLCPAPGYDRHFAICQLFGIEMITVPMTEAGPDMDVVEQLVKADASIKGIWCVPKYSNPEGYTCSDETVKRLASMETKAKDFRIFWDNAYAFHHLTETDEVELLCLIKECEAAGNPDRALMFASTSKITFAGAGISAIMSSKNNIAAYAKQLNIATIGPDKLNQLRHVKFFKNADGLKEHMKKHAKILCPKFDAVVNSLEEELGGLGISSWTTPKGGYFINLRTIDGIADKVVVLADELGVKLTAPAGSAFPYKKDPNNCNIRISPSFPSVDELKMAIKAVSVCVKIATLEKMS